MLRPGASESGCSVLGPTGQTPNLVPVLGSHVLINIHGGAFAVKAVRTVLLGSRDPVVLCCFHVEIVRLESASLQALKRSTTVIQGLACFGERYSQKLWIRMI